jgi:hypothetical protein
LLKHAPKRFSEIQKLNTVLRFLTYSDFVDREVLEVYVGLPEKGSLPIGSGSAVLIF